MRLPLYQIDAFASSVFRGNPAAVMPLEEWLKDSTLQAIAAENNQAETAFFRPGEDDDVFELRWFTPTVEVPLCGHATLATAFVLMTEIDPELEQVGFKPYPACHFNHSFADAALQMRAEGISAEQIERITALIHPTQAEVVCIPEAAKQRPASAYEAQFSVPYIVAQSFLRGHFTLDELEPEAYGEEQALALAAKVGWAEDPNSRFPNYYSGEIVVETKDGKTRRYREDVNRGSDANPLSPNDIEQKFWQNASRAVNRVRAEQVYDAVMSLDKAESAWVLMDALATN